MTKAELQQLIKDNVEVYKDFNEFEKYTNFTREEFNDELENGLFEDLTPCKGETILNVLEKRVTQNDFILLEKCLNEMDLDNQTDLNNVNALIRDYLKMHDVFYIKSCKKYFVNFD